MARPPSPLATLRRLFARSSRPMYALDERRRIVFANDALAEWTGVGLDQLLGLECVLGPGAGRLESLAAGLAPPLPALLETRRRVTLQAPRSDASAWRRRHATVLTWSEENELTAVFLMLDAQDCGDPAEDPELRPDDELRTRAIQARASLSTHATAHLLGDSALMRRVRQQVEAAGATRASVLIVGPEGAGREEVAHAVHYGGAGPPGILPLSCRLLDAELLTNSLEDLERTQYDLAEGPGAILLLDLDRMPPESQGPVYERLRTLEPAPKLLATAAGPLSGGELSGFHAGLATLVSELVIRLPALSERPEDIPQLAQCALHEANASRTVPLSRIEDDAMDLLVAYPWFENQQELQQLVGAACDAAIGSVVRVSDLPAAIHAAHSQAAHPSREQPPIDLPAVLETLERELIQRALEIAKGNKAHAARLLSLRRARLLRRIDALGIDLDAES